MLRALAWIEIVASVLLLAQAVWPFSGLCSGRFMDLDCESRAIFGVNVFGPLGILGLSCAAWSLKRNSPIPQYFLPLGAVAIMFYWFSG